MIDQETIALDRELSAGIDWETRAHDLELEVAEWKAHARRWERRAKENDPEQLTAQCAEWKAKARDARDKGHTWRLLYGDLLEKVGRKLDLEGDLSQHTRGGRRDEQTPRR